MQQSLPTNATHERAFREPDGSRGCATFLLYAPPLQSRQSPTTAFDSGDGLHLRAAVEVSPDEWLKWRPTFSNQQCIAGCAPVRQRKLADEARHTALAVKQGPRPSVCQTSGSLLGALSSASQIAAVLFGARYETRW